MSAFKPCQSSSLLRSCLTPSWVVSGAFVMGLDWWLAGRWPRSRFVGFAAGSRACFRDPAIFRFWPFGYEAISRSELTGRTDLGTGPWVLVGNRLILVFLLAVGGWAIRPWSLPPGLLRGDHRHSLGKSSTSSCPGMALAPIGLAVGPEVGHAVAERAREARRRSTAEPVIGQAQKRFQPGLAAWARRATPTSRAVPSPRQGLAACCGAVADQRPLWSTRCRPQGRKKGRRIGEPSAEQKSGALNCKRSPRRFSPSRLPANASGSSACAQSGAGADQGNRVLRQSRGGIVKLQRGAKVKRQSSDGAAGLALAA